MSDYNIKEVHISTINNGDTILHEGKITTVNKHNIKIGGFCGRTIFGDSYKMGTKLIKKVIFK